jgi:hypothetical protein
MSIYFIPCLGEGVGIICKVVILKLSVTVAEQSKA